MKYTPRQYQLDCIEDCVSWIKKSVEPAVVEATVSFGKSLVIALLAKRIADMSGKKVLILCPNGTLVKQNKEEVIGIGEPCSVFSASLNSKSTSHAITIGTPQSIKNSLSRFGSKFAAIIIDEGEGLTQSVIAICNQIKEHNPNARIIGFTGTPFRTGTGYVYRLGLDGKPMPEDVTVNPFYVKLIHRTDTKTLMDLGYLTPMVIGAINVDKYDTSSLVVNSMGRFDKSAVDRAYHGHGRETSAIVADIIAQSKDKAGVMIFGATLQHCEEIMASLPPELSRMVGSNKTDNERTIEDFKKQRFKYLVNKDMLTVGANFPHVDVIALLRKTESRRLLEQILGRGIRLCRGVWDTEPGTPEGRKAAIASSVKPECLFLDYTSDNAETHYPEGDLWQRNIRAQLKKDTTAKINCECPTCGGVNEFGARPNPSEYGIDKEGYFTDLSGHRIDIPDVGPMPAHYGRRCLNLVPVGGGRMGQCRHRWTCKECPACGSDNDIAARYCTSCKAELVDPNAKLAVEFRALKRSPYNRQIDEVLKCDVKDSISGSGKPTLRVDFTTPYRSFSIWIQKEPRHPRAYEELHRWDALLGETPKSVEYQKEENGFFRVFSYNKPHDVDTSDKTLLELMKA